MRGKFFLIIIGFCTLSCRHSANIPDTPAMSFQKDVQPIILGNCTAPGCHGLVDSRKITLETYDDVIKYVSGGNAVNSKLYQVITGKNGQSLMPPTSSSQGQLTDAQIKVIYLWIMQGAKNN